MNSQIVDQMTIKYEESVDQWTLDAVASGVAEFWELVCALPGVYPSAALKSVSRLAAKGKVEQALLPTGKPPRPVAGIQNRAAKCQKSRIPQHPLAYDWRFSDLSAVKLMDLVLDLAKEPKTIAFLGTPTLYLLAAERSFRGKFLLVDRNPHLGAFLPQDPPRAGIETLDIINWNPTARETFQVVVADPPWYEDETNCFLWVAARLCELDGHILLSFPSIGARPGMAEEWVRLLETLPGYGLEMVRVEESALSYLTPLFEHNSLRAEGFDSVAGDWRRGDLVVLRKTLQASPRRPALGSEQQSWREFVIDGASIWVQPDGSAKFQDPTLLPLVTRDILPTVSRRDSRRKSAQVWTAGNRVFGCNGTDVVAAILRAFEVGDEAQVVVAQSIDRGLTHQERGLVSRAMEQIKEILDTESKERKDYENGL